MFRSKCDPGKGIIYSTISREVKTRDLFDYIYHLDREFGEMEHLIYPFRFSQGGDPVQ